MGKFPLIYFKIEVNQLVSATNHLKFARFLNSSDPQILKSFKKNLVVSASRCLGDFFSLSL